MLFAFSLNMLLAIYLTILCIVWSIVRTLCIFIITVKKFIACSTENQSFQILCSNLMDLIQKSVIQPYRPERIFSFLLLCRCFTDLMKVDKASELLSLLPNDMKYKTEYKMLQTSINSIK